MRRVAFALVAAFGLAGPAAAELRMCNETGELQSIALGYKGETDWRSQGWWNIQPGDCAVLISGALTKRYYYYFADSEGGTFRGQRFVFCTSNSAFEILGDTDCADRGHIAESFREIDTGETATAFTLTLQASKSSGAGASIKAPGGGEAGATALGTQTVTEAAPVQDLGVDMASLTSDLPEGRHGPAFRTAALFQGCELEEGRAYCGFHAEGVKLRVYFGGPTPADLMYALEEMALNAAVELEGDAVEPRGQERAVVVRAVRPNPSGDPFAATRAALQGDWVSDTDRQSEITIRGSEIYVRYEGAFTASRFLRLAARCDGFSGAGPVMLQTAKGGGGAACYRIVETGRRLRLTPVQGGAEIRFRRP